MLLCIVLHNAPALQNDPNMILEKRNVENPLFRDFVDGERTKNKRQATILSSARLALAAVALLQIQILKADEFIMCS